MMGVTHKATGLCAGAYVAAGVRLLVLPEPVSVISGATAVVASLLISCLAARAALWNDLDHFNSRATHSFGPLTYFLHSIINAFSVWVFDMSATDEDIKAGNFRGHRGLAHFAITAIVVGVGLGWGAGVLTARSPVTALGLLSGVLIGLVASWIWTDIIGFILGLFVTIAVRTVFPETPIGALALVTAALAWLVGWSVGTEVLGRKAGTVSGTVSAAVVGGVVLISAPRLAVEWQSSVPQLALAVGLGVGLSVMTGMLAHSIGDGATKTGVPLFWPIKIKGRRFYPIHIRREGNRLHTGKGNSEKYVRIWSFVLTGLAVLAWIPGLGTWVWSLYAS